MSLTIFYLSASSLKDEIFLRELSLGFTKFTRKFILLYSWEHQNAESCWFQAKRISAHFSEQMVANIALCAHHRSFLQLSDGELNLNRKPLETFLQTMQGIIISPVFQQNGSSDFVYDAEKILRFLYETLAPEHLFLFPDNPLSPLGSKPLFITPESQAKALSVYPEEARVLRFAAEFQNAVIAQPKTFSLLP